MDDLTVRILFNKPTPFWADAFVSHGIIIPKHLFADYKGAKSREAPNNLKPIRTGTWTNSWSSNRATSSALTLNPDYHMPNRPYFDTIEMKGGGDAVPAARAATQMAVSTISATSSR